MKNCELLPGEQDRLDRAGVRAGQIWHTAVENEVLDDDRDPTGPDGELVLALNHAVSAANSEVMRRGQILDLLMVAEGLIAVIDEMFRDLGPVTPNTFANPDVQ